jgi:hypothetical protein
MAISAKAKTRRMVMRNVGTIASLGQAPRRARPPGLKAPAIQSRRLKAGWHAECSNELPFRQLFSPLQRALLDSPIPFTVGRAHPAAKHGEMATTQLTSQPSSTGGPLSPGIILC